MTALFLCAMMMAGQSNGFFLKFIAKQEDIMTTDVTVPPQKPKGIKRQKVRKWVLRLSLALTILVPLLFAFAAIGHKLGLIGLKTSFGLINLNLGPKLAMLGGLVGLIALVLAMLVTPRKGIAIAIVGLIVPGFIIGRLAGVKAKVDNLPFIHDVTTDTQDVPMFTAAIMDQRAKVEGVNSADYAGKKDSRDKKLVSVLQSQAFPEVRPLILEESPAVIFGKAETIAKQMGWNIATSDVEAGIIEATDTTFWYGFQDDVIIRIKPSEGGGTVVDIRSLSRVGGSDLGKNAARVTDFLSRLKEV